MILWFGNQACVSKPPLFSMEDSPYETTSMACYIIMSRRAEYFSSVRTILALEHMMPGRQLWNCNYDLVNAVCILS